ncbi:MAG TPA: sugar kinase [Acidimicrobiia bacterium]|nr:sugar kinase [Acidimicrobiia bacterium]
MTLDVLTFGEAMLRLSPPTGEPLARAAHFDLHVAGAEANVAVALAGLGRSVTWISRLPDNDLGRRVSRDLAAAGVDLSHVGWESAGRLGTYFVELGTGPRGVSVIYDRQGSAATAMTSEDLPAREVARARLVHLTGITPALSRSCQEATETAATWARGSDTLLSVDINYRAKLWSVGDARRCLERIAAGADLAVCTAEDARDVFGLKGDAADVAAGLGDRLGSTYTVVTDGADGAVCWHHGVASRVDATPTGIVDRLGAGDAFTAGVVDGLLDGDIDDGLRRGSVLAAVALATRGDQVWVTRSELNRLLGSGGRRLDR